jgi:hypothetical protein
MEKDKKNISHPVRKEFDKRSTNNNQDATYVGDRSFGKSPRMLHNIKSRSPGPGRYDIEIKWEGKEDPREKSSDLMKSKKPRDWSKIISKKPEKNIYYDG